MKSDNSAFNLLRNFHLFSHTILPKYFEVFLVLGEINLGKCKPLVDILKEIINKSHLVANPMLPTRPVRPTLYTIK